MAILKPYILVLTFLVIGCKSNIRLSNEISSDEYVIYGIIIDSLYAKSDLKPLVTIDSTDAYYSLNKAAFDKNDNKVNIDVLDRFKYYPDSVYWELSDKKELQHNYHSFDRQKFQIVADSIKSLITLRQVSSDSLKRIFARRNDRGWSLFYELFPNSDGVVTFSRVGFNSRRNQAVVYSTHTRAGLDGVGLFILLHKENGVWYIKQKGEVWVS